MPDGLNDLEELLRGEARKNFSQITPEAGSFCRSGSAFIPSSAGL